MGWVSNRRPLGVGLESRYVSLCLLSAGAAVFAGEPGRGTEKARLGLEVFWSEGPRLQNIYSWEMQKDHCKPLCFAAEGL